MTRLDRCYVLFVAAALATALIAVPLMDPGLVASRLWCFDHLRRLPLWLRAAFAVLAFAACFDKPTAIVRAGFVRWTHSGWLARFSSIPPNVLRVLMGALLFALFWAFRNRNFALGDSATLLHYVRVVTLSRGHNVTFDEPLELLIHSWLFRFFNYTMGWGVELTYAWVSCVCGVAFCFLAARLWQNLGVDPKSRRIALGILLSAGFMQIYFGHVENYSIVGVGMLGYVVLAQAYLAGRVRLFWPAAALGLSLSLHLLAGWLLPSLLYLWVAKLQERSTNENLREFFAAGVGLAIPIVATLVLCLAIGEPLSKFETTHLAGLYFVFLLDQTSPWFHFQFLSGLHWVAIVNQLALVGLPGLLTLTYVTIFHRPQIDLRDPFVRFLGTAALCFQLFVVSWNPNIGPYRDFDLFSVVGVGYGLVAAYLLATLRTERERVYRVAYSIVFLSLLQTSTFVLANHWPTLAASTP